MIVHAYYLKDARVRRYAEFLSTLGHHVDVLCLREDSELNFEIHNGVSIYRINVSRHRGGMMSYIFEYLLSFLLFFYKLNKLYFSGNRYELIHIHNFPNFLVFTAAIQKILGTKIILDVHDPMPELFQSKFRINNYHPLIRLLYFEERISIIYANCVITANHFFKTLLEQRNHPNQSVKVILNAPDSHFFNRDIDNCYINLNSLPFNILYVGTIAERYGIETGIRAVAKLKQTGRIPNIKLTIIPKIKNEGKYYYKLLNEVQKLGMDKSLNLLEPVPHDQMPKIIRDAHVSIYTPLPDIHMDIALSLKIPEVVAIGRPLVTSRLSVLEKYFGEEALFMCEPGNVDDCAAKIFKIYDKPEEAKQVAKCAQKALYNFRWENQRELYIK